MPTFVLILSLFTSTGMSIQQIPGYATAAKCTQAGTLLRASLVRKSDPLNGLVYFHCIPGPTTTAHARG